MQRTTERHFALVGAAACLTAWCLSTICVPPLVNFLGGRTTRRPGHGLDFAEWIVTHERITAISACSIGLSVALVLLQPSVQNWIALQGGALPNTAQYKIERSLTGTTQLAAEIRFSAENTQRMKFLERADIVRIATEKVKHCPGVTGAVSLAQMAPEVARPGDDAKTRERNAYLVKSNKAEEGLRAQNEGLGLRWLVSDSTPDGDLLSGETWTIQASVAELTATSPQQVLGEVHRALQDVLRFHAGVSHELSGEVVQEEAHTSSPSRRPMMIGLLAAVLFLVAAVGSGSLGNGIVLASIASTPALAVLMIPGFRPHQFGVATYVAVGMPLSLGVLACVRLVHDLNEWSAATSTRAEALAFAYSASMTRSRQALFVILAAFAGISVFAPEVAPTAVRVGVWTSVWAMTASLMVFPLLLSGRMGRFMVRDSEQARDTSDDHVMAAPIRLEPAVEAPHFDMESNRRRVRNAG